MESDFDRYYQKDLAALIWVEEWPASMLWTRIVTLPEGSAFVRKATLGHSSLHELLAQIRDAVTTSAHRWRMEGKPQMYERPTAKRVERGRAVDPTNRSHVAEIKRFFGTPN